MSEIQDTNKNQTLVDFIKKYRPSLWRRILNRIESVIDEVRVALGGWRRDLIWCPSQIRKKMKSPKGEVELYLRWRWSDPWSAIIIFRIDGNEYWTEDLFRGRYYFCDEDYSSAEKQLLNFYQLWADGKFVLPMNPEGYFFDLQNDTPKEKILPIEYFQTVNISANRSFEW